MQTASTRILGVAPILHGLAHGGTRVVFRSTFSDPRVPVWAAAVSFTAFELPRFIMERCNAARHRERAERERPQA